MSVDDKLNGVYYDHLRKDRMMKVTNSDLFISMLITRPSSSIFYFLSTPAGPRNTAVFVQGLDKDTPESEISTYFSKCMWLGS
jgi:hypothetical protein